MKKVTIYSPIKLSTAEIDTLKQQLKLTDSDHLTTEVNTSLIAGLKIVVDGQALDLTVKRQLAEIAGNN